MIVWTVLLGESGSAVGAEAAARRPPKPDPALGHRGVRAACRKTAWRRLRRPSTTPSRTASRPTCSAAAMDPSSSTTTFHLPDRRPVGTLAVRPQGADPNIATLEALFVAGAGLSGDAAEPRTQNAGLAHGGLERAAAALFKTPGWVSGSGIKL
jgi:hypothetical protein